MKILSYVSVLMGMSLVVVTHISADVNQNWQTFKQKAKAAGEKIVDPVNLPKYKKLYKEAQAELNSCVGNQCQVLGAKYKKERIKDRNYRRGFSHESRHALEKYSACKKKVCPVQYNMTQQRLESLNKRIAGIAIGTALGAYGAAIGGAVTTAVIGDAMDSYAAMDSREQAARARDQHNRQAAFKPAQIKDSQAQGAPMVDSNTTLMPKGRSNYADLWEVQPLYE